jgi:hypothetical protein
MLAAGFIARTCPAARRSLGSLCHLYRRCGLLARSLSAYAAAAVRSGSLGRASMPDPRSAPAVATPSLGRSGGRGPSPVGGGGVGRYAP